MKESYICIVIMLIIHILQGKSLFKDRLARHGCSFRLLAVALPAPPVTYAEQTRHAYEKEL